jgi:predicted nucleotide-binding protein (sugar kinase/HSP70/actin superfamily)
MTTNEIIEPIVEDDSPRDINTLLSLDTYQGMSDTEIEMLFDFRVSMAMKNAEIELIQQNNEAKMQHAKERYEKVRDEARKTQEQLFAMLDTQEEIKMVVNIPEEITPPNLVNLSEVDSNG